MNNALHDIATKAATVYMAAAGSGQYSRQAAAIVILDTLEATRDVGAVRGWVEKRYADLTAAQIREAHSSTMFHQTVARIAG
jgi:hypothetical protein